MNTEKAIEDLATAFSQLSQPEHRDLYQRALEALVRLSKSEKLKEILGDLENHPDASGWLLSQLGMDETRTLH
jgi:hypothetical protein